MNNMSVKLGLVLVMSLFVFGCASTQPYEPVEYAQVVNVPGQSQKDIYDKARQWFSQYFVSGESVVDYEDKDTGTIIGNGIATIDTDALGLIKYRINYNIRLDTKDGKFRALTKVIKHTNTDSNSTYEVSYVSDERKKQAENHIQGIVRNIESYITDKKNNVGSDW